MDAPKDKLIFPIKIYKNKSTVGNIAYRCIDANNFSKCDIKTSNINNLNINTYFDFNSYKYIGDKYTISDNSRVLVYNDEKNKLYGLVIYTVYPQIWWLPKSLFTQDLIADNAILNADDKHLVVIDADTFEYSYKSSDTRVSRNIELKLGINNRMELSEFQKALGIVDEKVDKIEETPITEILKQEIIENPDSNDSELKISLDKIIDKIVDKEINNSEQEIALQEKQIELNRKERELNKLEYNLTKARAVTPDVELGDIEVVYNPIDDMIVEDDTIAKSTYDLIFKVLGKSDSITIPFEIFKQFTVIAKSGALERNADYTRYVHIALIKINKTSKEGLLAVIDVDTDNYAKVTVLEKYGLHNVTPQKLFQYENNYRQWKRDRSFVV